MVRRIFDNQCLELTGRNQPALHVKRREISRLTGGDQVPVRKR